MMSTYKRTVAKRYRSLMPDELHHLPSGELFVSPKHDGELWFLKAGTLVNANGRTLTDVPLLDDAPTCEHTIAGELVAVGGADRPRVGDVSRAIVSDPSALRFIAFDLAGDPAPYAERLAVLRSLLDDESRVRCVETEQISGHEAVRDLFDQWSDHEGIVVRAASQIFKVKPVITFDAMVMGYTVRPDETQVSSVLLGMMREDQTVQVVGKLGVFGSEDVRRSLLQRLQGTECGGDWREASSSGAVYRMVAPTVVLEVRSTDVMVERRGAPITRMVATYSEGWRAVRTMPSVSLLSPVFVRVRDDKAPDATDTRLAQLLDRAHLPTASEPATGATAPRSEVTHRQVWTRTVSGRLCVRKLVVWKTNKGPDYPAFVVHWTCFSSGRAVPLKRTVKLAADLETALSVAEDLIIGNIKRGWQEAILQAA